jgi:ribosomal protein S18 acetylase RimI-like enzyme
MSARQTVSSSAPARVDDEILLRVAAAGDAAALSRAAATFFLDTFGDANRREDMEAYLASAFSQAKQHEELVDADNRIWLAIAPNGDIAGYAHVRRSATPSGASISRSHAVEIARIYAGQQWQGRGLGAALMDQCVVTAREWGGEVLWLGVWERNRRAIAFYEKHGFQVVGEQPFLLGADLQRDLVMVRRLTNGD